MAEYFEPTEEQRAGWAEWVAGRPDNVRAIAERFNPWTLYRMKTGAGNRCTLYSFGEHEDGSVTLTVNITGEFNAIIFDRQVFGVKPEDLEECDLPAADETLGSLLNDEESIDAVVDVIRAEVHSAHKSS